MIATLLTRLLLFLALASPTLIARTITLSPDQKSWFSVLSGPSLDPGDEIVLKAGTYSDERRLEISQQGTKEKPIIIRAAKGARVIFNRPDAKQNSINLAGCQHLIIRDLEITGGSSGIRIGKKGGLPAKFITLENLHIHHIGGGAVTANYPGETYESLTFRRNNIHHTGGHGEAFYLGSNNKSDGSTNGYIFNSIIENNYIHDLKGGTVTQGDGIELKDGSFGNIIRDNVIHDTNYPGIIVYGTDGKTPNTIERNVIWNTGDHGIQAAADAVIRNNIIFDTKGQGIYCRNHQSAIVGNLTLVHNTVLSHLTIRIIPPEKFSGKIIVANNALATTPNLPSTPVIDSSMNITGIRQTFPTLESDLVGLADPAHLVATDFNNTPRADSKDVGAYKYSPEGNPGWKIQSDFKSR